jgi:hypothetical protein
MAAPAGVEVLDARERERYEIYVDGELAGYSEYKSRRGVIAFVHTEIEPPFRGRGLADVLIAHALDAARAQQLEVLPFCPFVLGYIERHREYAELVPEAYRGRFGLG